VRAFFGGADPIGHRIRFTTRQPRPNQPVAWRTIVGIAPPIRHGDPSDEYRNAVVYLPYREETPRQASLLIRSGQPPTAVENVVRREVEAIDADQPVGPARSIEELMAEGRGFHRLFGALFGALAFVALILSAAGLYAVTASSVAQRRQELAVRMAVGASGRDILWLIVRSSVRQLAVGTVLGIGGGIALGTVLRRMLVAIEPVDPTTFAIVLVALTAVSLSACLVPARRAAGMAPLAALRAD
jgi:putative ABC transport system permease protein